MILVINGKRVPTRMERKKELLLNIMKLEKNGMRKLSKMINRVNIFGISKMVK